MTSDNENQYQIYYFTDEEEQLQPITLTRQHKGAIRAIRKVSRRKNNLLDLHSYITTVYSAVENLSTLSIRLDISKR